MPIRLWSTVETQLQNPVSAWGRSKRRDGAFTATAMTCLLGSPKRLQERDDLVDFVPGQSPVGHPGAFLGAHRLHGRGVLHPSLQVVGGVLEDRSGEGLPGLEMGEVGTDPSVGVALDAERGVTGEAAALAGEELVAVGGRA